MVVYLPVRPNTEGLRESPDHQVQAQPLQRQPKGPKLLKDVLQGLQERRPLNEQGHLQNRADLLQNPAGLQELKGRRDLLILNVLRQFKAALLQADPAVEAIAVVAAVVVMEEEPQDHPEEEDNLLNQGI